MRAGGVVLFTGCRLPPDLSLPKNWRLTHIANHGVLWTSERRRYLALRDGVVVRTLPFAGWTAVLFFSSGMPWFKLLVKNIVFTIAWVVGETDLLSRAWFSVILLNTCCPTSWCTATSSGVCAVCDWNSCVSPDFHQRLASLSRLAPRRTVFLLSTIRHMAFGTLMPLSLRAVRSDVSQPLSVLFCTALGAVA